MDAFNEHGNNPGDKETTVTTTEQYQRGKTLWDWMQLLIVPAVLAIGGVLFNRTEKQRDQERTEDNQRETALQAYLDNMSELLLKENPHLVTTCWLFANLRDQGPPHPKIQCLRCASGLAMNR